MLRHAVSATKLVKQFIDDDAAVAAVEFAVALPFLILLLLGSIDLTYGVSASRKVNLASSTASDLVAQVESVDDAYLKNSFMATSAIMKPFDDSKMEVVISSIVVDDKKKVTVAWSKSKNKTKLPRAKGSPFPLEEDLKSPGSSLVVAEVYYDYVPVIGFFFKDVWNFTERTYARPRIASEGTGVTCSATGC